MKPEGFKILPIIWDMELESGINCE